MARYLYSELSSLIQARANCDAKHSFKTTDGIKSHCSECGQVDSHRFHIRSEWFDKHETKILNLVREYMPSGSGFDSGTQIQFDGSHAEKIVFTTSFHHMNDGGFYDGWTDHTITVTPSLQHSFNLRISGRNRNDIKEYIHEEFSRALKTEITRN